MRLLSVRLIVSLIIGVTLVSLCTSYYQVLVQNRSLKRDLLRRAEILGESLARNVERDLERDSSHTLKRTVQQFANREHLAGLAVYDPQGHPIAVTTTLQPLMASAPQSCCNPCNRIATRTHSCGWEALPSTSTRCLCTAETI